MKTQNNQIDFSNQIFFVGIDVHKKQWTVTIRNNGMALKTFSMNPSPEELSGYLNRNYPNGIYKSIYEAGFCGYWIDRELKTLGIENIVVNPADIPTKSKERRNRNDKIDSRKLSRELEAGTLEANYIPSEIHQEIRSLCRLRRQLTKDTIRLKNRIKCFLLFYGHKIPEHTELPHWSGRFIEHLGELKFNTAIGKDTLQVYLGELVEKKQKTAEVLRLLRKYTMDYGIRDTIEKLMSVPGIGFITAITLYTELIDINRFKSIDALCNYVGLSPSVEATDQKEYVKGLTQSHNKYLRNILIEASWVAVRKDPVLTHKFSKLTQRMPKQKAIIRISKKLLSRIRAVWKNNQSYQFNKDIEIIKTKQ